MPDWSSQDSHPDPDRAAICGRPDERLQQIACPDDAGEQAILRPELNREPDGASAATYL